MEGFKNTTRMKTFGEEAPQAYAKGGAVKPMVKAKDCAPMKNAGGGDVSKMTRDQRMASMEKSSRAMTPAETRSLQAIKTAKAAAPKQGPLIKPAREMTPAERRMVEMDRPTNASGSSRYKMGGKVGGSKVPFAVKKVMRKAEGGAVSQIPEMPNQPAPPPPMISDTGSGYVPKPSGGFDPAQVKRMQELAAMMGNMPPPPQEPTPQSVFGGDMPNMNAVSATAGRIADMYGTSPGPMPVMPEEPMMPSAPMAATDYSLTPMPEMPMDDMRAIQAMQQMQQMQQMQEMQAMQAERAAAQIRREAAPRFMR